MSVLSQLLWWRHPRVEEPRPLLTSDRDRAERERSAQHLRELMNLVDAEIEALRTRTPHADVDD